jgi:6-pyruvoyltetrahydropterin/6-carboxytetrahydropterin synthase
MDGTSLAIGRADIGFSAAHFSVHGGRSELLHGHNYRVFLRLHGEVGAEGTIVDFGGPKRLLRALCAELDERMLLATRSAQIQVTEAGDTVNVREGDRRFVFPRGDVVLLPIQNTTCECLAAHLLARFRARLGATAYRLELGVEEVPGQGAWVAE